MPYQKVSPKRFVPGLPVMLPDRVRPWIVESVDGPDANDGYTVAYEAAPGLPRTRVVVYAWHLLPVPTRLPYDVRARVIEEFGPFTRFIHKRRYEPGLPAHYLFDRGHLFPDVSLSAAELRTMSNCLLTEDPYPRGFMDRIRRRADRPMSKGTNR